MANLEAFVYCWTDHKTNMLYVGYHKGPQEDGYICSSKWMLEEYKKRPEDFIRAVLAEGTQDDCHVLEQSILKGVNAKYNIEYYNQHNGDGQILLKHHTKETCQKISNSRKGMHFSDSHRKHLSESRKKVSKEPHLGHKQPKSAIAIITKKAKTRWASEEYRSKQIGKKRSEKARRNMSESHLGSKHSEHHKDKQRTGMLRKWKDPLYRKKISQAATEQWRKKRATS